jgi:hypothetical protein
VRDAGLGTTDATFIKQMFDRVKAEWRNLKRAPTGQRFVQCYERHQARDAPWLKPFLFFSAVFSFVIGLVLAFVPGPAILFFAISGALLAAESRAVATAFDRAELFVRNLFERFRAKRRTRQARAETRAGRIDHREASMLAAAAAGLAQPDLSDTHAGQAAATDSTEPGVPSRAAYDAPAGTPPFFESELGALRTLHAAATRHVHIEHESDERESLDPGSTHADDRQPSPQRAHMLQPIAASTRQGHAPMQLHADVGPGSLTSLAGTMKIWTSEDAQALALQNARALSRHASSPPPAVVTLAPPAIIGVQKRSRPSRPRGDRRAVPPPAPRRPGRNDSRA